MISNIWVEFDKIEETISTLKFSSRMMKVFNIPQININLNFEAQVKKYEKQIKELKQELEMHDQLKGITRVKYDPFTEEQRITLRKDIMKFVNDEIEEIEIKNLRQINEILQQVKIIIKQNINNKEEGNQNNIEKKKEIKQEKNKFEESETGVGEEDKNQGVGIGKKLLFFFFFKFLNF
jgi:kinesin family member 6/9